MVVNFSQVVYKPNYDAFARVAIFNPLASNPSGGSFVGRGIHDVTPIDVMAEEGSIFSDTQIILDVLEEEFDVIPRQGDQVTIPADSGVPALGTFEVIDTKA